MTDVTAITRLPALRQGSIGNASMTLCTAKPAKSTFRLLEGMPWMFADPQATLGEWRGRLQFSLAAIQP